jgi:hypothetical protein
MTRLKRLCLPVIELKIMKRLCKLAWLTILVVAIPFACAKAATDYNGDLVIGFTVGSGNDVVYDLGSAGFQLPQVQLWDLRSLLSGYDLSSVHWGVIGNTLNGGTAGADNKVFTTTAWSNILPGPVNQSLYDGLNSQTMNIYGLFPAAGPGQSASIASTLADSWYSQTFSPTLPTQYKNAYEDPNQTGPNGTTLWEVDTQGGPMIQLGGFNLVGSGVIEYVPIAVVPEPAPFALIASAVLLAAVVRRKAGLKA